MKRTKPRVEHVQRHLVALLSSCDSDKSFVAVILRFIDLDYTAAQVSNLVDLCTSLADDSSNHVVGDEYLLCEGLPGQSATHWLSWLTVWSRLWRDLAIRTWLMGSSTGVAGLARRVAIVERTTLLRVRLVGLGRHLRSAILGSRGSLWWLCVMALVGVWMPVLATSRLGHVRHNLHPTRNDSCRASTASCIG